MSLTVKRVMLGFVAALVVSSALVVPLMLGRHHHASHKVGVQIGAAAIVDLGVAVVIWLVLVGVMWLRSEGGEGSQGGAGRVRRPPPRRDDRSLAERSFGSR